MKKNKKDSADKLFDFGFEVVIGTVVVVVILLSIGLIGLFAGWWN